MSKVKIKGNASGTGVLTIEAPNTDTDSTITLPDGTGELIQADASGNVGIGVTPESWDASVFKSIDGGGSGKTGSLFWQVNGDNTTGLSANMYYNGGWKYSSTDEATLFEMKNDVMRFKVAPSGTADSAISWNTAMTIDNAGRVTMPYQPRASATDTRGLTERGNTSTFVLNGTNFFNTVRCNIGNHLNTSTGKFTCPVAGVYRVFFYVSNIGPMNIRLRKNGATINEIYTNSSPTTYNGRGNEAIVTMAINDYFDINIFTAGFQAGTQHKQVSFELLG